MAGSGPVPIDEYQRVPEILDAINAELNIEHAPGRFVLTGSTRFDALPSAAQSPTGRIHFVPMLPFCQGELDGVHEDFLDVALSEPARLVTGPGIGESRLAYAERVCAGGMPVAQRTTGAARSRWFDDDATASLRRDATGISRIRRDSVLAALLARLAGQTGQLLMASAGQAVDLDRSTAASYVTLLEDLFLVRRIPAWGRTLRARATALPKIHLIDSGPAARLLQLNPAKLAALAPTSLAEFGHLLETFTIGELLKQASWSDQVSGFGNWRTHDGREVDLVIERDDGSIVGFEIKAARQVHGRDFKGLAALRDSLGAQLLVGFLLTAGDVSYRHDDKLFAPVHHLWQPAAQPRMRAR